MGFSAASAQARDLPNFTELVEKYSPAVVNISTTQKIQQHRRVPFDMPDLPEDSPFRDFFKHFFGDGEGGLEEFDAKSLGSGFIISSDGYLLTNNHVVENADEIIVRLSDRRELVAEVVGSDRRSDVALLKINATDLPVVKVGKGSALKVGEWVLAIGSPFGFEHSVTAGIVSAKGRSLPRENYVPFIQTDVAINPGNSGGPLFNLDGEVVGVNSQIYSRTGGFMGLSFAIPIEVAMDVAEQLKTKGRVARGWLGVLIQDVTRELAESFDMSKPMGALVAKVLPDSPASRAGFKPGDVVVEYKGQTIEKSSNLPPLVGRTGIGEKVPVVVIRSGKKHTLKVTIGELPESDEILAGAPPQMADGKVLGMTVTDVNEEISSRLEIGTKGVVVTSVEKGPAQRAGVRKGDVILMVNNIEVKNSKHFKKLVGDLPAGKSIPLLVHREAGPVFLALRVEGD